MMVLGIRSFAALEQNEFRSGNDERQSLVVQLSKVALS